MPSPSAQAQSLCWTEILAGRSHLSWIPVNAVGSTKHLGGSRWRVDVSIFLRRFLQPGEAWERVNGTRQLVRVDPCSGEKSVAIHYLAEDAPHPVFAAEADLESGEVKFLEAADLEAMNPEAYDLFHDPVESVEIMESFRGRIESLAPHGKERRDERE